MFEEGWCVQILFQSTATAAILLTSEHEVFLGCLWRWGNGLTPGVSMDLCCSNQEGFHAIVKITQRSVEVQLLNCNTFEMLPWLLQDVLYDCSMRFTNARNTRNHLLKNRFHVTDLMPYLTVSDPTVRKKTQSYLSPKWSSTSNFVFQAEGVRRRFDWRFGPLQTHHPEWPSTWIRCLGPIRFPVDKCFRLIVQNFKTNPPGSMALTSVSSICTRRTSGQKMKGTRAGSSNFNF